MAIDPHRLAYLAGLFDGEGSVIIRRRKAYSMDFLAVVSMTDEEPVRLLHETFGGAFHTYKIPSGGRKRVYRWTAYAKIGEAALRQMLPWLLVKRHKAVTALAIRDLGLIPQTSSKAERETMFAKRAQLAEVFHGRVVLSL